MTVSYKPQGVFANSAYGPVEQFPPSQCVEARKPEMVVEHDRLMERLSRLNALLEDLSQRLGPVRNFKELIGSAPSAPDPVEKGPQSEVGNRFRAASEGVDFAMKTVTRMLDELEV